MRVACLGRPRNPGNTMASAAVSSIGRAGASRQSVFAKGSSSRRSFNTRPMVRSRRTHHGVASAAAVSSSTQRNPIQVTTVAPAQTFGKRSLVAESRRKALQKIRAENDGVTAAVSTKDAPSGIRNWRFIVFALMWAGYVCFYFTRSSFTFVSPVLKTDLNLDIQAIGRISTLFPIMYGFSKFASGILADILGARGIFAVGLLVSGCLNILFSTQSNLAALSVIWAANGFFQGFGAPACAKLLTQWYPSFERGTWWAAWCTANNTGGFLIPLIAGGCAQYGGWRLGMMVPGVIGIVMGIVLLIGLRDKPQDVGLPPANPELLQEAKEEKKEEEVKEAEADKPDTKEILFKYVLKNKAIWALAFTYFFVYAIRQGLTNWTIFYVSNAKGIVDPLMAAAVFAPFELGGFFGGFLSGVISDKVGGYRIRVCVAYMALLACTLAAFWLSPYGNAAVISAAVFACGFAVYGPQMLIGLIGAELSHPAAVATGNGLLGWIAYLGAAWAGEPLAYIVQTKGWNVFFPALIGCTAVPLLLLSTLWNARTFKDLKMDG